MAPKRKKIVDHRRPSGLKKSVENAAIDRFFEVIDSEHFAEICLATDEPKFRKLAAGLSTPFIPSGQNGRGKPWSPLRLCQELGINLHELNEFYRNAMLHIAQINSVGKMPAIMMAVVDEALPKQDMCPECKGEKLVESSTTKRRRQCGKCNGLGTIMIPGSNDARKLLWDQLGLVKRSPLMAQQINVNAPGVGATDLSAVIDVREKLLKSGD